MKHKDDFLDKAPELDSFKTMENVSFNSLKKIIKQFIQKQGLCVNLLNPEVLGFSVPPPWDPFRKIIEKLKFVVFLFSAFQMIFLVL